MCTKYINILKISDLIHMDKYPKDFPWLEFQTDGDTKLYRCKLCADYKQANATFGRWRVYKGIKRSNLTDHQRACKGQGATRSQPTLKRTLEDITMKSGRPGRISRRR